MNIVQKNCRLPFSSPTKELAEQLTSRLENGGLAQIVSLKGGSRTWFALSCLGHFLNTTTADPPLFLWLSNEGELYPEALYHYWGIPLSRMLMIKAPSSEEVWRTSLDAVQTGLFTWVLVKAEQSGTPAQMRKLQLTAEKTRTKVLILCQSKLPHWTLKISVKVPPEELIAESESMKLCASST